MHEIRGATNIMEAVSAVGQTPSPPQTPQSAHGGERVAPGLGPAAAYSPAAPAGGAPPPYAPPATSAPSGQEMAWASSSLLEAASGRIVATLVSGEPVIISVLGAGLAPADLPTRPSAVPPPHAVAGPAPAPRN